MNKLKASKSEVSTDQNDALREANERAERAEAELAKLKQNGSSAEEVDGASSQAGRHAAEPGSLDRPKQPVTTAPEGYVAGEPEKSSLEALREDSMMNHLLESLDAGKDIGHYGRLVFAMVARHFLTDDEVIAELTKDRDFSEDQATLMLRQVEGRDYNPPRRERILQWQAEQEFPIVPNANDPDCGNVYKSLRFPKELYDHIGHYDEAKAGA